MYGKRLAVLLFLCLLFSLSLSTISANPIEQDMILELVEIAQLLKTGLNDLEKGISETKKGLEESRTALSELQKEQTSQSEELQTLEQQANDLTKFWNDYKKKAEQEKAILTGISIGAAAAALVSIVIAAFK